MTMNGVRIGENLLVLGLFWAGRLRRRRRNRV
jgi:hypothetical protein